MTARGVEKDEVKPGVYGFGKCEYTKCRRRFPKNKTFQRFCQTNFGGQCRALAWHDEMRKRSQFYLKVKGEK